MRSLQLNQAQAMSVASRFYDNSMGEVSAALSAGFSWVSKNLLCRTDAWLDRPLSPLTLPTRGTTDPP